MFGLEDLEKTDYLLIGVILLLIVAICRNRHNNVEKLENVSNITIEQAQTKVALAQVAQQTAKAKINAAEQIVKTKEKELAEANKAMIDLKNRESKLAKQFRNIYSARFKVAKDVAQKNINAKQEELNVANIGLLNAQTELNVANSTLAVVQEELTNAINRNLETKHNSGKFSLTNHHTMEIIEPTTTDIIEPTTTDIIEPTTTDIIEPTTTDIIEPNVIANESDVDGLVEKAIEKIIIEVMSRTDKLEFDMIADQITLMLEKFMRDITKKGTDMIRQTIKEVGEQHKNENKEVLAKMIARETGKTVKNMIIGLDRNVNKINKMYRPKLYG